MPIIYLSEFKVPSEDRESNFLLHDERSNLVGIYDTVYPFKIFNSPDTFEFPPITIFYGGNGSGKSTLLNLIAEKLNLTRQAPYSKTDYFDDYCNMCRMVGKRIPNGSKIITSDDIFRRLSDIHILNTSIDDNRSDVWSRLDEMRTEIALDPYIKNLRGLDDYERFKEYKDANLNSTSKFLRDRTRKNLKSRSNGETSMEYLVNQIQENALYLLDEPENSLAPSIQLEFKKYIEESARFFHCQFIIATHSPILLACGGAKIYNLDTEPVKICNWNELENVKTYAEFFRERMDLFN